MLGLVIGGDVVSRVLEKGRGDDGSIEFDRHENTLAETVQLIVWPVAEDGDKKAIGSCHVFWLDFNIPVNAFGY